jgi:peptide/nickel transport system substrate-binding protein
MKKTLSRLKFALAVGAGITLSASAWAAGTLKYATIGEPPSLDQQVITSDLATTIAHHLFEGLYTFDANYAPTPLLASGETVSNGGKTIVINLRKDVTFHNGQAMTSKDVVASLNRWGEHGSRGKVLFNNISSVKASGDHQIILNFNKVFGPWKNLLAFTNGGPVVYPAAIAEAAGKKPIATKDYIGTGPYKFSSWKANRYLEVVRHDGYYNKAGNANGYGGARAANFDKIHFIPVSDVGTRVSGVKAGDYDYAESIPGDLFADLDADGSVSTVVNGGPIFGLVFMNSKEGPLKTNFKLRQAIQAALNKEDALRVAIGPEKLWRSNGSFMPKGNVWYSESGTDNFSRGDADAAKKLAAEAGYKGEPIKFMVSTNYPFHYDTAIVYTKQLAKAGFNIDLQVYDWATLIKKRAQPDQWDLFFTHHGFVPDPVLISVLNPNYPGWWTTEDKANLVGDFTNTADDTMRRAVWAKLQGKIYEQVPTMKTGDIYTYNIASPKLKGLGKSSLIWPHFWGVTK